MDQPFEFNGPTLRIVTVVFLTVFAICILGLLVARPGVWAKRNEHSQDLLQRGEPVAVRS